MDPHLRGVDNTGLLVNEPTRRGVTFKDNNCEQLPRVN
jgi:hypothetical protein